MSDQVVSEPRVNGHAVPPRLGADHHVDFDHADPDLVSRPYPVYEDLRERCPVAHSDRYGGFWIFSRYADIMAAELDPATYASAPGVTIPLLAGGLPSIPLQTDPPEHRHFRALLQPLFTRPAVARYEPRIREIARDLLASVAPRGEADLAREVAAGLPPLVIAELFGLPASDCDYFRGLADALVSGTDLTASAAAGQELIGYLGAVIEDRRTHPADDLATLLAGAQMPDREVTEEERLGMAMLTVVAGHETTVASLASMLAMVGSDSALQARLIEDPSLIPAAVEESLRLEAPVQNFSRTLTCPVEHHGTTIPAGDRVMLLFGSGNRDAERFEGPEEFRVDRKANTHLSFGAGIHRCLGAALGQLEMRVVLEETLAAIPGYTVDHDRIEVTGMFSRVFHRVLASWPVAAPAVSR